MFPARGMFERRVRHWPSGRQQVLKLLINYTHRWFARFFLGVMDTAVRNTRTGNKYVAMYVDSESVGFTHECLAECEGKLSGRL